MKMYLSKNEGLELIRCLKAEPAFWNEFVKFQETKAIFNAKMRACNIRKEYFNDLSMELFCFLYRDNWKQLDRIREPERFWGWFAKVVNTYFGFRKNKETGEYLPKKALRELLHAGTTNDIRSLEEEKCGKKCHFQIPDNKLPDQDFLVGEYRSQFFSVLEKMKSSSRKRFPLYAEVIERVVIKEEDRQTIVSDFIRRGILKQHHTTDTSISADDGYIRLRDNFNNNIYKRAKDFFNMTALQQSYECRIQK